MLKFELLKYDLELSNVNFKVLLATAQLAVSKVLWCPRLSFF